MNDLTPTAKVNNIFNSETFMNIYVLSLGIFEMLSSIPYLL